MGGVPQRLVLTHNFAALQDGKTLPQSAQWTSVTLATSGLPDEVVAVAASYDSTLRFGAQTPFSDQLSAHWAGGQWQYDPYHSSIITAGNGGTKPTQAAFTVFYNQGMQKYQLEQTLQPGEQMWMDIGKLIREHVSDKNGNALPADLTSGSYEVRDLTNKGVGTLFEGKVSYDRIYGHVTYGCAVCCGYTTAQLWFNPLGVPFGSTSPDGVFAFAACDGLYEDVSDSFYTHWSSANTSIATVDTYGTHTGVSVGSTTSSTIGYLPNPNVNAHCPLIQKTPSGAAKVTPVVTFSGISYVVVGQTATINATVNPTNNTTPISLSITSSAALVSPTGTFTTSTGVVVRGLTAGTATITATVSNSDGSIATVGSTSFSVTSAAPTATVTQRTSGQVSSDDAALSNYLAAEGTTNLGPFIGSGALTGCFIGSEDVGTITPSNYTGNVILHRFIVQDATYTNSTSTGGVSNQDDTAFPNYRDDNPQSGGSNGKVYDLDAPGVTQLPVDGKTYRFRGNFYGYAALPAGTKISSNYNFYVRVSCTKTSSGYQLVNDVAGDNQVGPGTTKTTWNLQ